MSTNGSRPRPARPRFPGSRRARLVLGVASALVIGAVLVAPVVLLGSGPSRNPSCRTTIRYNGSRYLPRDSGRVVQAIAVGVGIASGCGGSPTNVSLRSVEGVRPGLAVALASEPSTVYVRAGVCPRAVGVGLLRCLRSGPRIAAS